MNTQVTDADKVEMEPSKFTIYKNIPIPPQKRWRRKQKWGFLKEMEVGDSIIIDEGFLKHTKKEIVNVRAAMHRFGFKCSQRQQDDHTFRVWRTA